MSSKPSNNKAVKQKQPTQNSAMSRSAKRRMRRGTNTPYRSEGVYPSIQAPGVSSGAIRVAKLQRASQILGSARISADGLAFLKCAFAPPDFDQVRVQGVPDNFEGKSLVKKHRLVQPFIVSPNVDTYILLAPCPGVSHFVATVAAGTPILSSTTFQAFHYSDAASMFGGNTGLQAAAIVTKYRYVSNHIELVPTTNQMTWTGNIQSWKMPLSVQVRNSGPSSTANGLYAITGLEACNATNANQYTGPFNLGVYTACYSTGADFEFNSIIEQNPSIPAIPITGDFGQLLGGVSCLPGLDEQFDSLVVKISGVGNNTADTCIIKTWACVEYQVLAGSSLYEYTTFSPCDLTAIQIYKKVVMELPVGVAFIDNENFWRRVLQIIKGMSAGLTVLPGPYGLAARGVNSLSSAIDALTM